MSTAVDQLGAPEAPARRRGLVIAGAAGAVVLLLAMAWVWWSFFVLREEQTYRVLFSAGSFSSSPEAPAGGAAPAPGARLRTGDDGFATVKLSDGSVIKLMPNTSLDIEDGRANAGGDRFATGLRLLSGEIETRLERGDGREREMSLFSNSVAIGVRGTVFTVQEEGERARLMVTRGRVEARGNTGGPADVAADQGVVVARGQPLGEVTALPPPPSPLAVTAAGDGLRFAWEGASSSAYLVEIAEDGAFQRLLRREQVSWRQGTLAPLERDGRYHWRVAGIDHRGLRGRYSAGKVLQHDYHIGRSRAALQAHDPQTARHHQALSIQALDPDLDRLRQQGIDALEAGEHGAARSALETVLALRPEDVAASNALAVASYHLLDYEAARARFRGGAAGMEDTPGDVDARVGIALIDVRQGKFRAGLALAREVLERIPGHLGALQVAAMASVGLGDIPDALEYVRRALTEHPGDATALALKQTLESAAPPPPPAPQGGEAGS